MTKTYGDTSKNQTPKKTCKCHHVSHCISTCCGRGDTSDTPYIYKTSVTNRGSEVSGYANATPETVLRSPENLSCRLTKKIREVESAGNESEAIRFLSLLGNLRRAESAAMEGLADD